MTAAILPFPSRHRVTGEALLHARRYQETHTELRQAFAAERFFKDEWLPEFEAEFPEFANREFQLTAGLV